ncbi:MAG: hypothetical protein ABJ275_02380 [Maricaulaceae bacterium]
MKKIIFPILMILFVIGGVIAADFVKRSASSGGDGEAHAESKKDKKKADKGHGKDDKGHGKDDKGHGKDKKSKKDKKKKDKKKKDKGHKKGKGDHGGDSYDSDALSFYKFKRQFVVPVMTQGKIEALVIMNLSLELNSDAPDNIYTLEPKFRDALTRELLTLSNKGVFGENLTSVESYEDVRSTLLSAVKSVTIEGVQDILILDVARQEQ